MQIHDLIELQNQMDDEFRFIKSMLFLLAGANNGQLPNGTANEVAHFLAYRVEDIEAKFDVLCRNFINEINNPPLED